MLSATIIILMYKYLLSTGLNISTLSRAYEIHYGPTQFTTNFSRNIPHLLPFTNSFALKIVFWSSNFSSESDIWSELTLKPNTTSKDPYHISILCRFRTKSLLADAFRWINLFFFTVKHIEVKKRNIQYHLCLYLIKKVHFFRQ